MNVKPAILTTLVVFSLSAPAHAAREQIRIVGSSTVYPFVTVAAEQFGQDGDFKNPIVESTGTGGGFKLFCEGLGDKTPDISNASRPIADSEKELCAKNGVKDILEVAIGYDGIVLASKRSARSIDISRKQLFLALARDLPGKDGKLRPNPYHNWKEIDAALPDQPIIVYGPPPTSGTRDAFVELVMEKSCVKMPEFAALYPNEKDRKKACHLIREDGTFIESGEDDNVMVQKLVADERAFGVLGYSFYEENKNKVMAGKIEGVLPSYDSIESKKYAVSRSLFVYVKKQHMGAVPGIAEFVRELTSEGAIGPDGYMTAKGLLPMSESERKAAREIAKGL